jgi:hypothetical protein
MLLLRCERCNFRVIVTSRAFDRMMFDWVYHGTHPKQRRFMWPFRCHQKWMVSHVDR